MFSKRGASYLAIAVILLAVVNFAVITANAVTVGSNVQAVGSGYSKFFDDGKPEFVYWTSDDGGEIHLVQLNDDGSVAADYLLVDNVAGVTALCIDREGYVWFSVSGDGIYKRVTKNTNPYDFPTLKSNTDYFVKVSSDVAYDMTPQGNRIYFHKSEDTGIYYIDIDTNTVGTLASAPTYGGSTYGFIVEIAANNQYVYALYSNATIPASSGPCEMGVFTHDGSLIQTVSIPDFDIDFGNGQIMILSNESLVIYLYDSNLDERKGVKYCLNGDKTINSGSKSLISSITYNYDLADKATGNEIHGSNYSVYVNNAYQAETYILDSVYDPDATGGGGETGGGSTGGTTNGTAYYNITFNFVNSETGLPLNGVGITLEIYKNGELRSTWDTVVDSGFTLEVSEGSMIQIKQASKSGFISELEQAGMCKIVWVDPDLNPFLTNPYNVTIVFYPTTTNAKVHFIFIDTKTNAQIPDVDFVLKDTGDHVIAEGTYDYEFVLENATRGQ